MQAPAKQAPVRQRSRKVSSDEARKRTVALLGGLFFLLMALAGTGWFFKDQVKVYWRKIVARFDKSSASVVARDDVESASGPVRPPAGKEPPSETKQTKPAPVENVKPVAVTKTVPVDPSTPGGVAKKGIEPIDVEPPSTVTKAGPSGDSPPPAPAPAKVEEAATTPKPESTSIDPDSKEMRIAKALPPDPISEGLPVPPPPKMSVEPPSVKNGPLVEATNKPAPVDNKVIIRATPEGQPAAEALRDFFAAKTWNERLVLSQAQDKVKPLMQRYYESVPDQPVRVKTIELIRHEKKPETGSPLCVFEVAGPDVPEPLPVMAESTPDGWKVDWLAFIEFKDKLMLRFLQKWQDEPGRFHVMVRRTHYFDDDVPDRDKKDCFELMPPTPGYSGFVFVAKDSPLAKQLERAIPWNSDNIAAVVEIQWRKQDRFQWVEMTSVPQFNWRTAAVAASGSNAESGPKRGAEISNRSTDGTPPKAKPAGIRDDVPPPPKPKQVK